MHKSLKIPAVIFTLAILLSACRANRTPSTSTGPAPSRMGLASPAFQDGDPIPQKYTCDGENVSPPLTYSDVPEGTKTLMILVDDPDAKRFVHWLVYNIDPTQTEIAEGSLPQGGQQGLTGFGEAKYGGPCPPTGTHKYEFHLFALDNELTFEKAPERSEVLALLKGHLLAQGLLRGTYEKVKR